MNLIRKNNIICIIKFVFFSLIVLLICGFFMSKKENLDIDELYTYGLSNNTFQLDIMDNIEYDGNDLLLKYTSVKDGNEFNIKNVFFNQKHDTHPPLYYILINFISSINKNKFSIWYGLTINLFFMIILFWEMVYMIKLITKNEIYALGSSVIALFFYGLINMYIFTRMYVMLSAISLGFIILIFMYINNDGITLQNIDNDKNFHFSIFKKQENYKIESDIDKYSRNVYNNEYYIYIFKFLLFFYLICVIGILTQYHFMIIAGIYSLFFCIFLIYKKEYKNIFFIVFIGILSIISAYLIFPSMITHLFGDASLHGIKSESIYSLSEKLIEFYNTIVKSFSGNIIIFSVVLIISFISLFLIKNRILILIFISLLLYYIVISISATFIFARYLYNVYSLIAIFISSTLYLLCNKFICDNSNNENLYKSKKNIFKYIFTIIPLIVLFILCEFSRYKSTPFSLNKGDSIFHNYLNQNKDIKTLLIYRTFDTMGNINTMGGTSKWKLPRPLYSLKNMSNLVFCDVDNLNNLDINKYQNENKVFVIIYTTENDDVLLNRMMNKLNSVSYKKGFFVNEKKIYFNDYYHMYLLTKN